MGWTARLIPLALANDVIKVNRLGLIKTHSQAKLTWLDWQAKCCQAAFLSFLVQIRSLGSLKERENLWNPINNNLWQKYCSHTKTFSIFKIFYIKMQLRLPPNSLPWTFHLHKNFNKKIQEKGGNFNFYTNLIGSIFFVSIFYKIQLFVENIWYFNWYLIKNRWQNKFLTFN